ncbi:hypothetical protein [Flavobacterium gawalongense]|uniref:hypothetical protein n=1 Tax=Flavobacterium gawalongense TaxID=2594432 RepID=UPI00163DA60A|nr:hypothetical protein [Flavobacterium gawalongense]
MELNVYWTYFSKTQLQNIFLYHKEKVGIRVAKKLILGITQEVLILQNQLAVFQKE